MLGQIVANEAGHSRDEGLVFRGLFSLLVEIQLNERSCIKDQAVILPRGPREGLKTGQLIPRRKLGA